MTSNDPPADPGRQDPPWPQPYGQPYDPYAAQPYPQPYLQDYPQPQVYGGAYPPPMPPAPYAAPYGPAPYGPYGPGYGYPSPESAGLRNQAIGALVTNAVLTLVCCLPVGVAGIVVSAIALGRVDDQPESARKLIKWGWGVAIAALALGVIAIVVFIVLIAVAPESP